MAASPPWTVPSFDVKKKPPLVPKPPAARRIYAHGAESRSSTTSPPVLLSRRRWGLLGDDTEEKGPAEPSLDEHSGRPDHNAFANNPGYKASWQKWRCIPAHLEELREELLRTPPSQPPQPPSQEAVDFLESLLIGPEELSRARAAAATSAGAAQVLNAARRLREQAEAARRRRTFHADDGIYAAEGGPSSMPADTDPRSEVPLTREQRRPTTGGARGTARHQEHGVSTEQQERHQEHARRLRELTLEAEREQQRLLEQMRQEQEEIRDRRRAQEIWQEELRQRTEQLKRDLADDCHAHEERRTDPTWQSRWWRHEGRPSFNQAWWMGFSSSYPDTETEDDQYFRRRRPTTAGARPRSGRSWVPLSQPYPPASVPGGTPEAAVLEELRCKRSQPLEERKRIWKCLCLRHHPDKSEDKAAATAAFQQLQGLKSWFLHEH